MLRTANLSLALVLACLDIEQCVTMQAVVPEITVDHIRFFKSVCMHMCYVWVICVLRGVLQYNYSQFSDISACREMHSNRLLKDHSDYLVYMQRHLVPTLQTSPCARARFWSPHIPPPHPLTLHLLDTVQSKSSARTLGIWHAKL